MGSESSSFQNCKLEDTTQVSSERQWELFSGKNDGCAVSVFVYKNVEENRHLTESATNNLKVLRHPGIVKYLGWTEVKDGHRLITEPVVPLELQLESLSPQEICAGLFDILQALSFLHERGGYCHNNVSVSSIFTSQDGSWKLGCMEHVCRFEEVSHDKLKKSAHQRDAQFLAPEEKTGNLAMGPNFGHARDAYAFGVLVEHFGEFIKALGSEVDWFIGRVQEELLDEDPTRRPNLSSFLQDPIFHNDFVEIISFLKNITVKTEPEKKTFFGTVVEKLHHLPAELVARRLTGPLLSRFVLLDQTAEKELIPHFLHPCHDKRTFQVNKISPVIPKGLFQKYVIPELFKIFHVRDCCIRLVILKSFGSYVDLFDRSTLQAVILPQVLVGLRDSHDELVSASLHALAEMVPILGSEAVIGPNRHAVFKEGKPKFKTMNGSAINHIDKFIEPIPGSPNKTWQKNDTSAQSKKLVPPEKTLKDQARDLERQKKRDEARKRMEERRNRREERKKMSQDGGDESSDTISQQSLSPHHHSRESSVVKGNISLEASPFQGANVPRNDSTSPTKGLPLMEHENDAGSTSYDEEDIDKEIESEISAMVSTLSPQRLKTAASETTGVPVKVDWSDIPVNQPASVNSKTTKGMLRLKDRPRPEKLKDVKLEPEKSLNVENWSETDDNWGKDSWDTPAETSPLRNTDESRSRSLPSVNVERLNSTWDTENDVGSFGDVVNKPLSSGKPTSTKQQNNAKNSHDLGAEFDIKSIAVKKKPSSPEAADHLDFFADMEPVIKTPAVSKAEPENTKSTVSFGVIAGSAQEGDGGWGEDLEWGEENW